jgi:hypothetical protein
VTKSRQAALDTEVVRWPRSSDYPARLLTGCEFVCSYTNDFGIDDIDQAVAFKRTEKRDELWIVSGISSLISEKLAQGMALSEIPLEEAATWGLTVSRNRRGTISSASVEMLEILIRSGIGCNWPRQYMDGGLVDGEVFAGLLSKLEAELDGNAKAAQSGSSGIVATAQALHLNPRPSGTAPSGWVASCPQTNHTMRIDAEANIFGCGWCKRKGGPHELEQFVADRKAAAAIRRPEK